MLMKSGLLKLPELVFPPTRYVQVFVARSRHVIISSRVALKFLLIQPTRKSH
jgi:hypothetical protein